MPKSYKAIEAARQSINLFPDGVWFIGLASVTNPELVTGTLAETLQVNPEKEKPIGDSVAKRILFFSNTGQFRINRLILFSPP